MVVMFTKILDVTGLTQRFQTTVPKLVREVLDIKSGEDRIVWILENGEIKVQKTTVPAQTGSTPPVQKA